MKTRVQVLLFPVVLLFFANACGYPENGHANTPPAYPGSQTKTGVDSLSHPANIDRDTIVPDKH